MTDQHPHEHNAEELQREQERIDRAQGPGPVLDQDQPQPMPLFDHNDPGAEPIDSAIDPQEFAELGQRSGEELDHIRSNSEGDEPGVAGRAQRPDGKVERRS